MFTCVQESKEEVRVIRGGGQRSMQTDAKPGGEIDKVTQSREGVKTAEAVHLGVT